MISKAVVLGIIEFRNPDTKLMTDLVVCLDYASDLTFAVDYQHLQDCDFIQSPFDPGVCLKIVDPDDYLSRPDLQDKDVDEEDYDDADIDDDSDD
jgi:hypothetical protein